MIIVIVDDNNSSDIIVELNKDFYNRESINKTVKDFSNICDTIVKENGNFRIILKPKEEVDSNELVNEFCNYVLAIMKNNSMV